jgi:hypothetical protein
MVDLTPREIASASTLALRLPVLRHTETLILVAGRSGPLISRQLRALFRNESWCCDALRLVLFLVCEIAFVYLHRT